MIDEKQLIDFIDAGKFRNADEICFSENDVVRLIKNFTELSNELGLNEQQKTDWIPCEVEMPKTNGVYQTVRKVMEGDVIYYLEGASYFDGQNTWHNDIGVNHGREYPNVVAWQPIQSYKKEDNSNENT